MLMSQHLYPVDVPAPQVLHEGPLVQHPDLPGADQPDCFGGADRVPGKDPK
jgi:hypothetical protein